MTKNKNNILKKILFMLMIIIAFILINSTDSKAFIMGSLDIDGGQGISAGPEPYLFGDYFCADHSIPLTRTEDGTKGSTKVVYLNRNNGVYYNEQIYYSPSGQFNVEQSIAAGRIAYECGAGTASQFQTVVWSSGQWNGKPGYVNNLSNYTGTKVSDTNVLYERAEAWANFYYNLLKPSGMKLNIDVLPTSEDDLRIYVDQNARTYTEGPYMINILDASGNIINDIATEYHSAGTIGNLLYQELSGLNKGCSYFQFAKLNSATATVSYTDGSSDEYTGITILDANGNALAFPRPGEIFYIRVEIPDGESRTVSKIEPHFNVQYLTQIPGTVNEYKASQIDYELTVEKAEEFTDSVYYKNEGRTTTFLTNQKVSELADSGVKTDTQLENHLVSEIINSYVGPSKINLMRRLPGFTALFMDHDLLGEEHSYNNVDDYIKACIEAYQEDEKGKITSTTKTTYEYKDYENGGSYYTDTYEGEDGLLGTKTETTYHYGGKDYVNDEAGAKAAAEEEGKKLGEDHAKANMEKEMWIYSWVNHLPVVGETTDELVSGFVQPVIEVNLKISGGVSAGEVWTWAQSSATSFDLIGTDCTVEIGGKVWVDVGATKESSLNGRLNSGGADTGDYRYAGMEVQLYLVRDRNNSVGYAITDSNGSYHFDNLNALEDYIVVFKFNGQLYQQTYYKEDLSGGFSNAQEVGRSEFNDRFDRIDSYPSNYNLNGWKIAYGKNVKLTDNNGNYISNGTDSDGNNVALTYIDAWNQFVSYASSTGSYEGAYNSLRSWLQSRGVGTTDTDGVIQFIRDCMITAETRNYPVYDQFVIENIDDPGSQPATETAVGQTWNSLYITSCDQSRNVDFGINERDTADLALQKDVYKATVRVNGKTQTYMYSNKELDDEGNWEITIRNADGSYTGRYSSGLYNGNTRYTREIRKSEYLYDGTIYSAGGTDARDLKVYVTYRIVVRNQSQTYDAVVNEITDYFDTSEYVFDGTLNGDTYIPNEYSDFEHSTVTSYIGDRDGNYVAPLTVRTTSNLGNGVDSSYDNIGHGYTTEGDTTSPLYLSGIVMPDGSDRITKGGGMTFIYLTFEVKKTTAEKPDENGMANRIQMDVNVATGEAKGNGKQNIAEINGYTTYYGINETVPNTLNPDNSVNNTPVTGQQGGVLDLDSTVGNLTSQDLNDAGDLIITDDPLTNRTEDDTDKAPNIRLVFPESDDYERVASGYVYEDNRDQASNQAMVGNGRYDEGETLINGVTVQLVELVQNVDEDGIPIRDANGNYAYLGEYIWTARTWDSNTRQWVNVDSSANSGSLRYYSGQGNYATNNTVAPIISGAGATAISGYTFTEDSTGQYAFKGMPAGDFIVRFIYGDTTQTVLTTDAENAEGKEVADFLSGQTPDNEDGYISTSGLNLKSYNGQDYKSTTYQSVRDGENITAVPQDSSYNGVYGYGYDANGINADKYNTQNYNYTESAQPPLGTAGEPISNYVNEQDGTNKDINYYYNIAESRAQSGISDAKDVGNVRTAANDYGRGITGIDGEDTQTIVNGRSEVLTAGLKVASTDELADGATTYVDKQIAMIKELMENTEMVAQSGVINAEVEYNTNITTDQSENNNAEDKENRLDYALDDIDLGLEERPIAQLVMNKEVANVRITLQNGTILFDTNRPVTNMSFAEHAGHDITYNPEDPNGNAYRLVSVAVANNNTRQPELITTYMDEELMYGARIEVDYAFTVTNVGEVDYLDNQFYYTGVTNNPNPENISTTTANTVVDYISNNMQFVPTNSSNTTWSIRTVNELTSDPNDPTNGENYNYQDITNFEANNTEAQPTLVGNQTELINNKYYNTLNTYNTIVTTKALGETENDTGLYPEELVIEGTEVQSSAHTTMMLSTTLTPDSGEDTMVYNNLSEILQVSNSQGRRLKWSVTGNQPMANQDLGSDTPVDEDDEIYTKVDLVTPKEIDADSSQEILILPPTGSDRNYTLWIIVGVVALAIIAGGVILIRRYFKKK